METQREEIKENCSNSFFKKYVFIYLVASGLSCCTRDLSLRLVGPLLRLVGFSLVVACGLQSTRAQ